MKVVISNPIGADTSTGSGQWPHSSYHQPLLSTLREAASRAARQQQSILASVTFPIAWHDALRVFTHARQAGLGECFFWASVLPQPSKHMASPVLPMPPLPGVPYCMTPLLPMPNRRHPPLAVALYSLAGLPLILSQPVHHSGLNSLMACSFYRRCC